MLQVMSQTLFFVALKEDLEGMTLLDPQDVQLHLSSGKTTLSGECADSGTERIARISFFGKVKNPKALKVPEKRKMAFRFPLTSPRRMCGCVKFHSIQTSGPPLRPESNERMECAYIPCTWSFSNELRLSGEWTSELAAKAASFAFLYLLALPN